jgi:hypothetical protein
MAYMKTNKDYQFTYTAGTAGSTSLAGQGSELYLCATTSNCYFEIGGTATSSASTYLPKDSPIIIPIQAPTTIQAIGTGSGTMYVIEFI